MVFNIYQLGFIIYQRIYSYKWLENTGRRCQGLEMEMCPRWCGKEVAGCWSVRMEMQGRHSKAGSEIDNIHKKQYLGNEEQGWGWKGHEFRDGPEFV